MSERPVEDEIMDEARKFGHSMAQLMRMHAQAHGWLEKRKVRREISLTLRQQRRSEQAERVHHKAWTAQMIHRYQIAAQARYERWTDPNTTFEQRRRDDAAAIRHIEDLRERIVGNTRLTEVERGIALDCLESARMWPYKKDRTPEMLARAPKVRGLDALRYRARLARETDWIQRRRFERETAQRDRGIAAERQEPVWQQQSQSQQVGQEIPRPTGELDLAQKDAVQKIRHAVLENQPDQLRAAGDAAVRVGLTPQRVQWEMQTAEQNSKYVSEVSALRNGSITTWRTYSPTEAEAAQWAAHNTRTGNWLPGVQLKATTRERGNQVPIRLSDGGVEHVTTRTTEWAQPAQAAQRAQGRGEDELESLKQRHRLSIEHNADLADQNATLTRRLTALRTERDELVKERNRYKTERDESVQKLAERTPAAQRFGSQQRQHAEKTRNHPGPGLKVPQSVQEATFAGQQRSTEEISQMSEVLAANRGFDQPVKSAAVWAMVREITDRTPDSVPQAEFDTKLRSEFGDWWFNGGSKEYAAEQERQEQQRERESRVFAAGNRNGTEVVTGAADQQHTSSAFAGLSTNAFASTSNRKGMSR
ncbi:hypothetical protein [Nocardia sp. NPDC051750]|uniref:hypothetical protein n=1 Tax=Nocardia sp. NPDC051750 TaxID=3364325 RepID=UPI0037B954EC